MALSFDIKKFQAQLPSFYPAIHELLKSYGFVTTLVGGTIRDFFKDGILSTDWDIEVRHDSLAFNRNQWKELGKDLSRFGKMTFLPYDIIRLAIQNHHLEFSPPRKEIFHPNWDEGGHSNFTAEFDFKLPFEEAVKRRDFTINAMGVRFISLKEFEFLDPLDGLRHLREKTLYPCGPDFAKDPVRFMRAIRFATKFGFQIGPELAEILKTMSVRGTTPNYFWSEMQKSGNPLEFYSQVLEWSKTHPEIRLPLGEELIPKLDELKKILVDPGRHELWIIALEWIGVSCEPWQKFFSLSSDSSRRLARWAQSSKVFHQIMPEKFHGEFEQVRLVPDFDLLFDWYFTTKQLLQKNPDLPLMKMIEEGLPEWIHLYRFEPVKDVKHIDPPLRAKYQVWNLVQRL